MKNGIYQNHLGAQLKVTGIWTPTQSELGFSIGPQTLGDIFDAHTADGIFGTTHYLVTDKSIISAGYEWIGEVS